MKTVTSKDGTQIAYDQLGSGPAVVLVDGALCSRALSPLVSLAPLLAKRYTVFSYDRRGRNESGDAPAYAVEREIEDLAAIIESAGGSAMVFGISSGAALAIQAAHHGLNIPKLALYEPPFHLTDSAVETQRQHQTTIKRLIQEGRRSEAVTYFQVDMVGLPKLINWILRISPMWKKLKAVAHTLCYDLEILGDGTLPTDKISRLHMPTIAIAGDQSPKSLRDSVHAVAKQLPNGKQVLLKDQNHNISAKAIAPVLEEFYS